MTEKKLVADIPEEEKQKIEKQNKIKFAVKKLDELKVYTYCPHWFWAIALLPLVYVPAVPI